MRAKQTQGFTIVELLIVVVVIAILAAITIISYNGIQSRAKTSASLATYGSIRDKTAAWNTLLGTYPDLAQLRTNSLSPPDIDTPGGATGPVEAKLPDPGMAMGATMDVTRANNGNTVYYAPCWDGTKFSGGTVIYWDFTTAAQVSMTVGNCP
jgi:prepilin-type N-terminal cleavage/methylation domain-containing protein